MTWRPLSRRQDAKEAEAHDALHDGIPEWLRASICSWIQAAIDVLSGRQDATPLFRSMERELRLSLDWRSTQRDAILENRGDAPAFRSVLAMVVEDEQRALDVIDYLLWKAHSSNRPGRFELPAVLETYLRQGGSAWKVADGGGALEKRVEETVAARASELTASGTRAGEHLRRAWHALYGRNPNASEAYREAVRGVEAAAIPVVSPKNDNATLGTIIRDMKAAPNKWKISLQSVKGDPVMHVIGMMELLWTAQIDRHGTADESVPLAVSAEQAEAAVHLALTLTHWFQAGAVQT